MAVHVLVNLSCDYLLHSNKQTRRKWALCQWLLPWLVACVHPVPSGGDGGILCLMFTLLPKEQAHVTVDIATKVFPWYCICVGLYLGIDSCSVSAERGACVLILCICVTDLPLWLLCWLLCCIARTCRTWCDGGSLPLTVHTDTRRHDSRKTFRLLKQVLVSITGFHFF